MLGAAGMGPVIQRLGFETGFFLAAGINLVFALIFFLLFKYRNLKPDNVPSYYQPDGKA
jgi:hypothetical protein